MRIIPVFYIYIYIFVSSNREEREIEGVILLCCRSSDRLSTCASSLHESIALWKQLHALHFSAKVFLFSVFSRRFLCFALSIFRETEQIINIMFFRLVGVSMHIRTVLCARFCLIASRTNFSSIRLCGENLCVCVCFYLCGGISSLIEMATNGKKRQILIRLTLFTTIDAICDYDALSLQLNIRNRLFRAILFVHNFCMRNF